MCIRDSSVNDGPVAVNDSFSTAEDTAYTATLNVNDLLLNDSDLDGDTLSVNTTPVSGPASGTLVLNADGTFTYTPNVNFNGTDSFTYEVTDGNGGSAEATVDITVNSVNDAPVVVLNQGAVVDEGSTITIDNALLQTTDEDQNSASPTYLITSAPSEGTLLINGCLLYTSPSPRDRTRSRMPSSA